jgi:hypothetical protein
MSVTRCTIDFAIEVDFALSVRLSSIMVYTFLYVVVTVGCVSSHFLVDWGKLLFEIVCTLWAPDFRKYICQ